MSTLVWVALDEDTDGEAIILGVFPTSWRAKAACESRPGWADVYRSPDGDAWRGSAQVGADWAQGPGQMFRVEEFPLSVQQP